VSVANGEPESLEPISHFQVSQLVDGYIFAIFELELCDGGYEFHVILSLDLKVHHVIPELHFGDGQLELHFRFIRTVRTVLFAAERLADPLAFLREFGERRCQHSHHQHSTG